MATTSCNYVRNNYVCVESPKTLYFGPEHYYQSNCDVSVNQVTLTQENYVLACTRIADTKVICALPDSVMNIGKIDLHDTPDFISLTKKTMYKIPEYKKLKKYIKKSSYKEFMSAIKEAFSNGSALVLNDTQNFIRPQYLMILLPNEKGIIDVTFIKKNTLSDKVRNTLTWSLALCLYTDGLTPSMRWFAASLGLVNELNPTLVKLLGVEASVYYLMIPENQPFDYEVAKKLVNNMTYPRTSAQKIDLEKTVTLHLIDQSNRNGTIDISLIDGKLVA